LRPVVGLRFEWAVGTDKPHCFTFLTQELKVFLVTAKLPGTGFQPYGRISRVSRKGLMGIPEIPKGVDDLSLISFTS